MSLTLLDIIMISLGVVSLVMWMFLYFKGLSKASLFEPLTEKEYPFKEVYFVGYAVTEIINYQYKSKNDRKLRRDIEVLYGPKYADYYLRVIYSQKITFAVTIFVLSFALYGLADGIVGLFAGFFFAGVAYYYFGTVTQKCKEEISRNLKSFDKNCIDISRYMEYHGNTFQDS